MKSDIDYRRCAQRLKALADPERLRIVNCLFSGSKNVGEIAEFLGDAVVNVSHHLNVLKHAAVVQADKQGRFVVYSLHPDVFTDEMTAQLKHIDLGCCRLELPDKNAGRTSAKR